MPSFLPEQFLFDRFRIVQYVMAGINAEIYRVQDVVSSTRDVLILKYYNTNKIALKERPRILERIANEKGNSRLDHPNIVKTLHSYVDQRGHFLLMEDGGKYDLFSLCDTFATTSTVLPEADAIRIFTQVLDAVAFLHANGIMHLDIKSENVFIDEDMALPKLGDFDWSRAIVDESSPRPTLADPLRRSPPYRMRQASIPLIGTLQCMAPEVLQGRDPTPATDVWNLGLLLYELLTNNKHAFMCSPAMINPKCTHVDNDEIEYVEDANVQMTVDHFMRHHVPTSVHASMDILIEPYFSETITSILRGTLHHVPALRLPISEIKRVLSTYKSAAL